MEEQRMQAVQNRILGAFLMVVMAASLTFAQNQMYKRVHVDVDTPTAILMTDYVLPAGNYVLMQVNPNDYNLFALYEEGEQHKPIALVRTTRVDYGEGITAQETSLDYGTAEAGRMTYRELRGWTIPGEDGWEVISVDVKNSSMMSRVR
jgi:hypothetical protein